MANIKDLTIKIERKLLINFLYYYRTGQSSLQRQDAENVVDNYIELMFFE